MRSIIYCLDQFNFLTPGYFLIIYCGSDHIDFSELIQD